MDADIAGRTIYKQFGVQTEPLDGRSVRFTITTANPDREGDVVLTGGIDADAFMRNPVVLFAHDYRSLPVGRCLRIDRYCDRLVATAEFADADLSPFGDQVYRMVRAGYLNATSIGFRPLEWTYDEQRGGVNFQRVELLEFSIVPVPANSEALVAASRAGIDTALLRAWAHETLRTLDADEPVLLVDEDDVVLLLQDAPDDLITVDANTLRDLPTLAREVLGLALGDMVREQTRRVINEARGRID